MAKVPKAARGKVALKLFQCSHKTFFKRIIRKWLITSAAFNARLGVTLESSFNALCFNARKGEKVDISRG